MPLISRLRRAAMGLAAAALMYSGPAHAQLRLHSNSEQELTAQLVVELEKARVNHLAALDAHRTYLGQALERERTLLVQRELAERDALVAAVLAAKSRNADPIALLRSQTAYEWTEVTGLGRGDVSADVSAIARNASSLEIERSSLRRHRASLIAQFEAAGGKGSYCDADGAGALRLDAGGDLNEAVGLQATCEDLADVAQRLKANATRAGRAAALIGDTSSQIGGLFGQARREATEAEALAKAQDTLVKTVASQVKALDDYYKCQLGRTSFAQAIRADAAAVQSALNTLAAGEAKTVFDPGTFRALWTVLVSHKIDPDCTKAQPSAPAAADPSGRASADQILKAIGALDKYAADNAVLALVRESALDVQGSALGEAIVGLAAAPGASPVSHASQRAAAALRIFGNLEQLYRAGTNRLPDVSGVLVALADVRMRQATAKIEAERLAEIDRLSKQRLAAVRERALLLADAKTALQPNTDQALAASLRRYAESINRGVVPATVLSNAMARGRYLPWVDREKAVVEASYAMLAPTVAQLQVYGKGGITPETLAQVLQVFGLGGIAVK